MLFILVATHFFLPAVQEFGGLAWWKSGSIPETTSSTKASTFCSIVLVSSCVTHGLSGSSRSSSLTKQPSCPALPWKRSMAFCVHAESTAVPSLSASMWHCRRSCAFSLAQRVLPTRHLLGPSARATVARVTNARAATPTTACLDMDAMRLPPCSVAVAVMILARGRG